MRNHFVFSGIWNLPFHGNRLTEGWLLANITQLQSGNPMNVVTASTYNGTSGTIRPTLIEANTTGRGAILSHGKVSFFIHATACARITAGCKVHEPHRWFWGPAPQRPHWPGLRRFRCVPGEDHQARTESTAIVVRIDGFDLLNHANFANPTLTATGASTSTFGQISATRTAVGDAGSSRQSAVRHAVRICSSLNRRWRTIAAWMCVLWARIGRQRRPAY